MANKRIKRVIIAGAGFSAPAIMPIQSRIIDRMAEVPEMDFLTGKMPEESMTFLDAFITVGLFLLDNYAKKKNFLKNTKEAEQLKSAPLRYD